MGAARRLVALALAGLCAAQGNQGRDIPPPPPSSVLSAPEPTRAAADAALSAWELERAAAEAREDEPEPPRVPPRMSLVTAKEIVSHCAFNMGPVMSAGMWYEAGEMGRARRRRRAAPPPPPA